MFFFQGYRVISIDIPCIWNHHEWIHAFEKFLDAINVHHVSKSISSLIEIKLMCATLMNKTHFLCFIVLFLTLVMQVG